jgi:hypothetical protein
VEDKIRNMEKKATDLLTEVKLLKHKQKKKKGRMKSNLVDLKISFSGDKATLEEVFGREPVHSGQMVSLLWAHIKREGRLQALAESKLKTRLEGHRFYWDGKKLVRKRRKRAS